MQEDAICGGIRFQPGWQPIGCLDKQKFTIVVPDLRQKPKQIIERQDILDSSCADNVGTATCRPLGKYTQADCRM